MFKNSSSFGDVREVRCSVLGLNIMFEDVRSSVLMFGEHSEHLGVIQHPFFPTLTDNNLDFSMHWKLELEQLQFRAALSFFSREHSSPSHAFLSNIDADPTVLDVCVVRCVREGVQIRY